MASLHRAAACASLAVIAAALLAQLACAELSLGSTTGRKDASIAQGGIADFRIFLFSGSPSRLHVSLSHEAPEGWIVLTEPGSIEMGGGACSGSCALVQQGEGYVNATRISVSALSPDDAGPGEYEIVVRAYAWEDGGGVSTIQSRTFRFSVLVEGPGREEPTPANYEPQEAEAAEAMPEALVTPEPSGTGTYMLAAAAILLASLAAYKAASRM